MSASDRDVEKAPGNKRLGGAGAGTAANLPLFVDLLRLGRAIERVDACARTLAPPATTSARRTILARRDEDDGPFKTL